MPKESSHERVFISAGSNLGNRRENLSGAAEALASRSISVSRVSTLFETEPVGFLDQPWFLNNALELETSLTPQALLSRCLEIERVFGRVRSFRNAPRILDLDLIFFGGRIICAEGLELPHPRMAERRFVLAPLAEIAPEVVHPILKRSVRELYEECADPSIVRPFTG